MTIVHHKKDIMREFFLESKTFVIIYLCSKLVDEKKSQIYSKLNRRIESLAQLKSNTTKEESEDMFVSKIYWLYRKTEYLLIHIFMETIFVYVYCS